MTVQVQDHKKRPIQRQRGVRQGDVISQKLNTDALEDVFKTLDWNGHMLHLRCADDIVNMAECLPELSWMLSGLNAASQPVGIPQSLTSNHCILHSDDVWCRLVHRFKVHMLWIELYAWGCSDRSYQK
ncbi:uncharacterized protein LOC125490000 [Plutella xylostella]|uniref:uncharacterized protein LOC125490000 n=1 Tax=Plutella xylostella TaxID=51655 RepID=UPI0020330138|nr:uncharacterized protein LOC125490000 [Plutella xylostella]